MFNTLERFSREYSHIAKDILTNKLGYKNTNAKENPKAVVGLADITVRPMVEADMLSFSVPYNMFLVMEKSVKGSFLEKDLWHRVVEGMKK